MSNGTPSNLSERSVARYYLARLRERLWLKPLISCLLSLGAAFVAGAADYFGPADMFPDISAESIERLLSIISTSMLVIAVFAVGAMLSAYASASNSATPRSFPLVVGDDVSQNALSTFIGAFIFSIVALVALLNAYYAQAGRFVLFLITIVVFALVILGFVRWVDRIARLGRLGNTISKIEAAADAALQLRAKHPTLGAAVAEGDAQGDGIAFFSDEVGYVQNIDVAKLQTLAESMGGKLLVSALPGVFATPDIPLGYFLDTSGPPEPANALQAAAAAFVIGGDRTFESDPRFGLVVLSEIASRALSPAVNDPGTAIDIIGTIVRLLVRWARTSEADETAEAEYDRVMVPAISLNAMFDDAFNAIARDGAATVEVTTRLQKAFQALSLLGHEEMKRAAETHASLALRYAQQALELDEEREALAESSIARD